MDHDDNVVGAAVLFLADRMRVATEAATGRGGAQPAALTSLHGWANGSTIETLSRALGLSHSRTVRVVDALEVDGLAKRRGDPADRRRALVDLTSDGQRAAKAVLEARAAALKEVLSLVSDSERTALAAAAESMLGAAISSRADARLACRLCDLDACGHLAGHCPSTLAADRAEALRTEGQPIGRDRSANPGPALTPAVNRHGV